MRADARVGRPPQLGEDVAHLLVRQRIVRLHRRMARHRRGDPPQRVLDARAGLAAFQVLGKRPDCRFAFAGSSSAGTADSITLSPPKSSTSSPNRSSTARVLRQRLPLRRRQLEHDRREQPLALERARR